MATIDSTGSDSGCVIAQVWPARSRYVFTVFLYTSMEFESNSCAQHQHQHQHRTAPQDTALAPAPHATQPQNTNCCRDHSVRTLVAGGGRANMRNGMEK